ncbi:MAG: hypothetical protein NWT08_10615 [Akkermansiaceae bacterium]|jgi:hypothetical protein|nr:hypothetical protein [Akkermansiaceae bacterium]MDP4647283.1 hypothetical protein [Akkermansiaceae bacterium]MDP4721558.1 hypothetical protein [Akkermansiaceae bacterium]MDP4781063.1 hypothetical protein [Akkermansiaceae bacterium]MDP4847499.1 hypothetical protein [Akkermansiaceae bacterium]
MKSLLSLAILLFLAVYSFAAELKPGSQEGVGIIDRYVAHGNEVYRFVPDDKELRMIKMVPGQLGYKGQKLPEELEKFFAKALEEKKKVKISCDYMDHGVGKTAIGKKLISYNFVEE